MLNFIDTSDFNLFYLILILILTGLNIVFFISQKRENSVIKLKILIIILLLISIIIFVSTSLNYLTSTDESIKSTENVLFNNIFLFLLGFSTVLFFYSIHNTDDDVINLEKPSFFKSRNGQFRIGRVMEKTHKKHKFFLSLKDLEKHMFICGATGTGKSNFIQNFLMSFSKRYNVHFLLVEFKGEYHFLQKKIDNLLIIKPGENFSINIFNPEGSLPEVHAERIFDILKSGNFLDDNADFSPQMEKVLVEILTKVCANKKFQNWEGFFEYCKGYVKNRQNEIPMLKQTMISITNRIRRFSLGSLKAVFGTEHKIKTKELFNRNILIDLSSIIRLGGQKEDALFFLNMVLKYLWDQNLTRGAQNFKGIKHLTIVEDIQYFAPKDLTRQNKLTSYLEDIALLQRGTGECLISLATHSNISEDILANCGVLVCFKTYMEKEFLCKLLNLDEENEDYLSILEEGQCLVRVNSIKRPFLLSVPLIQRKWLENSEINRNNDLIIEKLDKLTSEKNESKDKGYRVFLKDFIKSIKNKLKKSSGILLKTKEKFKQKQKSKDSNILEEIEDFELLQYETKNNPNPNNINKQSLNIEQKDISFDKFEEFINKLYVEQQKKK